MTSRAVIDTLFEMAAPTAPIHARTYYHGTDKDEIGQKILADGHLKAPEIADLDKRYGHAHQRPVEGRTYLSPSIRYAVIYALGGAYAGHTPPPTMSKGSTGYVFVVDGKEITDVEPDEDSLGGLVSKLVNLGDTRFDEYDDHPEFTKALRADPSTAARLSSEIKSILTPNMYKKSCDGECAWQSKSGKRLLKALPSWLRTKVAEFGSSVGVQSSIPWSQAWRIDKRRSAELKKDGSNFFDVAERIA